MRWPPVHLRSRGHVWSLQCFTISSLDLAAPLLCSSYQHLHRNRKACPGQLTHLTGGDGTEDPLPGAGTSGCALALAELSGQLSAGRAMPTR